MASVLQHSQPSSAFPAGHATKIDRARFDRHDPLDFQFTITEYRAELNDTARRASQIHPEILYHVDQLVAVLKSYQDGLAPSSSSAYYQDIKSPAIHTRATTTPSPPSTNDKFPSKILFIGGGPGGFAGAADALRSGQFQEVGVWAAKGHQTKLNEVLEQGYLQADGSITGRYEPKLYTDLSLAVAGAKVIVNTMPAEGHEALFEELSSLPIKDAILFLNASTFASPLIDRLLPGVMRIESPSLPYVTRWRQGGQVDVHAIKNAVIAGASRRMASSERALIESLFSLKLAWQPDALLANLKAVNIIVHPAGAILGLEQIQKTNAQVYFYGEILGRDDVLERMQLLTDELVQVQRAWGYPGDENTLDILNRYYNTEFETMKAFFRGSKEHNSAYLCPTTLPNHRYLTQDVKSGLVFVHGLARLRGVPVPTIETTIREASELLGEDLFAAGRSIERMGLGNMTCNQILRVFGAQHELAPMCLAQ